MNIPQKDAITTTNLPKCVLGYISPKPTIKVKDKLTLTCAHCYNYKPETIPNIGIVLVALRTRSLVQILFVLIKTSIF